MTDSIDLPGRSSAGTRSVVVLVLDPDFDGALAFVQRYLRGVSVRATLAFMGPETTRTVNPSLEHQSVVLPEADMEAVIDLSARSDVVVVQVSPDLRDAALDPILHHLRLNTHCLLIEVDADGSVVRASGPRADSVRLLVGEAGVAGDRADVVVVGVDGSPSSDAALRWAARTATALSCRLRVVRAGPRYEGADLRQAPLVLPEGLDVESVHVPGAPADALLREADGARLLVVGRHGTNSLVRSALGSVGDTCARLATCPVVIVPPAAPTIR